MVDFSRLLSALKFAPHLFFGVALATGIALFAPSGFIAALGLAPLLADYRPWIGATFLLSSSVFVSAVGARAARYFGPTVQQWLTVRQFRKSLLELSPAEKELLAEYLQTGTTTQSYSISNGIAGGLVAKRILYRASNVGHPGSTLFDFNLQPWAWDCLRKHPELVSHVGRSEV